MDANSGTPTVLRVGGAKVARRVTAHRARGQIAVAPQKHRRRALRREFVRRAQAGKTRMLVLSSTGT